MIILFTKVKENSSFQPGFVWKIMVSAWHFLNEIMDVVEADNNVTLITGQLI